MRILEPGGIKAKCVSCGTVFAMGPISGCGVRRRQEGMNELADRPFVCPYHGRIARANVTTIKTCGRCLEYMPVSSLSTGALSASGTSSRTSGSTTKRSTLTTKEKTRLAQAARSEYITAGGGLINEAKKTKCIVRRWQPADL